MNIRERLGKELLFLDGGMGTLLQAEGLAPGELPETWNIEHPEKVEAIHRRYYEAGSDVVLANTFGANVCKFHDDRYTVEEVIRAGIANAKRAGEQIGKETYVALDMGPTGKLLKPMGDLDFDDAYEAFAEAVRYGEKYGADLIHIETMSDTYEVKAAILAAKENSSLPVFVTMIFDERGKLLTGGDVPSVVAMLEGLRVDALGLNCGLGPKQMLPILNDLRRYTSLPIIVKPNAGLPKQKNGETYYDVEPDEFARIMQEVVKEGACVIGGCCGTTPEHIKKLVEECKDLPLREIEKKHDTIVSSYGQAVILDDMPRIIGERINPTGKKKFKEALKNEDMDYILKEAITQQDKGAHILDVNVGLPDIDEVAMMEKVVKELQSVTSLPLQIDTVDGKAMERAMRIYNGKPMINSVNGKQVSMDEVFPLVRKYGGVVVGLTVDSQRRVLCARNHSATHLLQKALRTVLGTHVEQSGSYVDDKRLRFDFSHFSAMTPEELQKVEDMVNESISRSLPVVIKNMPIEEARKTGAQALFGEKYGDIVRVVNMGDYSIEFCGGTHVANTSEIGAFKILSESGVAAGVRRIEALTSKGLMDYYGELEQLLHEAAKLLKATPDTVSEKIAHLQAENKELHSEVESLKSKLAKDAMGDVMDQVEEVAGVKVIAVSVEDMDMNGLRDLGDQLKEKIGEGVVVIASSANGKVSLMATATDEAMKKGAHAGNLIKAIASCVGGGGGGRPNMAQAGGKNPAGIPDALAKVKEVLAEQIK